MADVDSTPADESFAASEAADDHSVNAGGNNTSTGSRRQTNGTIGSVYSGNKIKHLKKEDGIPLWRKDIQYQFLKLVFEDKTPVFTRISDGAKNRDFADIYIDAMARSSKTSKILKDKLQNDKPAAINMAMVCLLVNFGRMNTTLNFFPEMRAQLRTYHSIPSLQADQDPNAYKQLQDAPRLKSILKGASEDTEQPPTLEKLKELPVPRTNPVHLIFLLAQYAPRVSEIHFFPPRDFFDLVMRSTLSSKSRARAFLWLMWWYLESDFSREAALNNPFGPGQDGEGTGGLPIKVPPFESLTEEQADLENQDTPEELEYGEAKRLERKRILEEEENLPRVAKRPKKADASFDDDVGDHPSSTSTPLHPSARRVIDEEEDFTTPASIRSRFKRVKRDSSLNRSAARIVFKTRGDQGSDAAGSSPPPTGNGSLPILHQYADSANTSHSTAPARRPRPLTQHQLAVEQHRRQRIEYILAMRRNEAYKQLRQNRQTMDTPFLRYRKNLEMIAADYDSEKEYEKEDEQAYVKGGVMPNPSYEEDYGEAAHYFLSAVRKAARRLDRWDWERANGPREDRKKIREARRQARLNNLEVQRTPIQSRPSRSKPSSRSTRRKEPATAASTPASGTAKKSSSAARHAADKASAAKPAAESAPPIKPEPTEPTEPTEPSSPCRGRDDGLDDLDRDLLGTGDSPAPEHDGELSDESLGGGAESEDGDGDDDGDGGDEEGEGDGYGSASEKENA